MGGIDVHDLIGDPQKVAEDLQAFAKTAQLLSSRYPRMVERYPDQWIALHSGKVRAHGDSLDAVLRELDAMGLSRDQAIIRFIDKEPRTMIL